MDHGILLSDSILDVPGTLTRLGGDQSLFVDLIDFFVVDAPQCMSELQRAAEAKDFSQARWNAHTLKGLVAGCGGTRAAEAAHLVEAAAQADGSEDLQPLIESLQKEVGRLHQSLLAYRAQIVGDMIPGSGRR
jgi:HPt (histidine-containing phosphotransfer) domain-containing protein